MFVKRLINAALAGSVALGAAAHAGVIDDLNAGALPAMQAGASPDTPAGRVDANTSASPFSGVVSISIQYGSQGFICSGALVGKRQVVSAGHCVDKDGVGKVIDLKNSANKVLVQFNSNGTGNAVIAASAVTLNPSFQGFGNCPDGVHKNCVNDDLAVITLATDAPATAKIYKVDALPVLSGTRILMAGYGWSGSGSTGYTVAPSFNVKRLGLNTIDLFGLDDEGIKGINLPEVFYADFDGNGKDTFCVLAGICGASLGNGLESTIGPGDSGGPSFASVNGELVLVAENTFTSGLAGSTQGTFGTWFGGILLNSYTNFLLQATGGDIAFVVPEPGSFALLGLGGLLLAGTRRRRR